MKSAVERCSSSRRLRCDRGCRAPAAAATPSAPLLLRASSEAGANAEAEAPLQPTAVRSTLPRPPELLPAGGDPRARHNAAALAFLGDALWEVRPPPLP